MEMNWEGETALENQHRNKHAQLKLEYLSWNSWGLLKKKKDTELGDGLKRPSLLCNSLNTTKQRAEEL